MEGYIKATPKGVPEILPGYVSNILGSGQYGDTPTSLTCPFQILLGLLSYG